MTETTSTRLTELQLHERELVFPQFRCVLPGATADQEEWIRRRATSHTGQ